MKRILFTLLGMLCIVSAMAQWSNNPAENNRITPAGRDLYGTEFEVSKDNITYVLFSHPYSQGVTATKLQILDKDGKKLFPDEGKLISDLPTRSWTATNKFLSTDNNGNAIVIVHDCRNAEAGSQNISYTAYKVSPTGEMLWGEDGVDLERGQSNSSEAHIESVSMDDGSTVFAWFRARNNGETYVIELQRVSAEGELLWEEVQLKEENVPFTYPYLEYAGNNQVILIYAKGTNQDLYARKIDFDGETVWPEDTRIYRGGFGSIPIWTFIRVISDKKGGVFVGWYDDRLFTQVPSTYVAHVKSNGSIGFTGEDDGLQVGYDELNGYGPSMAYSEKEDCLYVVWRETSYSQSWQRITGQKIAMSGELLWGPNGIEICPLEQRAASYCTAQVDPDGNMAAFYQTSEGYGNVKNYAALLDSEDGSFIWKDEQVMFTTTQAERGSMESSQLIDNKYWITMWNDQRLLDEEKDEEGEVKTGAGKIYLQRINIDGTLGNNDVSIASDVVDKNGTFSAQPSIIKESTRFVFDNNKAGKTDISAYSVTGQKVAAIFNGNMEDGMQNIEWNAKADNVPAGIYVVTLTTAAGKNSIRVIVK